MSEALRELLEMVDAGPMHFWKAVESWNHFEAAARVRDAMEKQMQLTWNRVQPHFQEGGANGRNQS